MKKFLDILKEKNIIIDCINVILGIAVIVLIVLLFKNPSNVKLVTVALGLAGLLNMLNGYRQFRRNKNSVAGKSMLTTGTFILVIAVVFGYTL